MMKWQKYKVNFRALRSGKAEEKERLWLDLMLKKEIGLKLKRVR